MPTTLAAISLTAPLMLLATAAVALPIAAHLLNRRTRQRVVFPTVALLAEAAAGQSRLFRMRRLILLALRCLAIVLIAYAFARPMWVSTPAGAEELGEGQAVVLVVDVSASSQRRGQGVNLFPRVQAAALGVLDEVQPGRDVANLVIADAQPTAAFAELVPNPESLRDDVQQLQPTADRADLPAAVSLAASILREATGRRRIVIVSDMQGTNWEDVSAATLSPGSAERPIEVIVVPVEQTELGNVGLAGPRVQPAQPIGNRPVDLSVEVVNYSADERSTTVRLDVDGRERQRETVTLEPWQSRRVSFPATTLGSEDDGDEAAAGREHHRVTFSIGDDALLIDNRAYLAVGRAGQLSLALVTDVDTEDTDAEPYYLLRAVSPHGDERDDLRVTLLRSEELAEADLAVHDMVVLSDAAPLAEADRAALHRFVESGGGLVATIAGVGAIDRFASLGELSPWQLGGALASDGSLHFDDGAWTGDVLRVFDLRGRDALSRVGFRRAFGIEEQADSADVLVRFDDGTPALARMDVGDGRVVAANFSAAPSAGDLAARGIFVPLVHILLESARPTTTPTMAAGVGAHLDGKLRDPEGQPVRGRATQPGFYTLERDGEPDEVLAVNVDARESDLRRVSQDDLQRRLTEATGSRVHQSADGTEAMHLTGRPLWPYFVLAALAMLALELAMLAKWRR
ncbi:MAG: BatA and WFA domain-containing protein [Phycisphaeraceae bacterium]